MMSEDICSLCQRIFKNNKRCSYFIIVDGKRKELITFCPKKK